MIKDGWRTSEFWISILTIVGVFVLLGLEKITVDDVLQLIPVFISSAGYSIGRGLAKSRSS